VVATVLRVVASNRHVTHASSKAQRLRGASPVPGFPDHVGMIRRHGSQRASSKLQATELAQALSNLFAFRITASIATNSWQAFESSREQLSVAARGRWLRASPRSPIHITWTSTTVIAINADIV
jgi:hypothetical protein